MASIFSKIVAGEIPCYRVAETDNCLAFLDVNPIVRGHVLCIPKKEVDYIFDLDDKMLADMMVFAKKVAKALEKNVECLRIGIAVIGIEVPHTHIHLVPINRVGDLNFANPKCKLSDDEMKDIAERISKSVQY